MYTSWWKMFIQMDGWMSTIEMLGQTCFGWNGSQHIQFTDAWTNMSMYGTCQNVNKYKQCEQVQMDAWTNMFQMNAFTLEKHVSDVCDAWTFTSQMPCLPSNT